ncbi:ABC transporter permease [Phyllobacterium endophyticum]|uniref:ABC transporter permease n=1 Tax=Phyllobacterium endophyticum TaxID=1149773 RepID=UPI0011C70D2E|nr:ABC transporter permease [Phyllobacterium endophyticum]TXR50540.1 ABC transporter permease [Phyllobacterium endophyticum]
MFGRKINSAKRRGDAALALCGTFVIAATALFLLLPVIATISMAFDSRNYLGPFPPPALSLKWFEQFMQSEYLWSGFYTSLLLATITSVIATAIGASAGLAMNQMSPKWRDVLTTAFLSPLVLPGIIIGFGLLMFFSLFQILPPFPKLLVGHLVVTVPYTIRMALIGFAGINPSLREAALSLGANERQAISTVILPLAKNSIAAGAIFAFAFSMDDLTISVFLSDFKTYTLPVALVSLLKSSFDLTIAAAAVFLMGLTVILLVVLDRVLGLERVIGNGIYKA